MDGRLGQLYVLTPLTVGGIAAAGARLIIQSVVIANFTKTALYLLPLASFNYAPINFSASRQPIPITVVIIDYDMRIFPAGFYKASILSSGRFDGCHKNDANNRGNK